MTKKTWTTTDLFAGERYGRVLRRRGARLHGVQRGLRPRRTPSGSWNDHLVYPIIYYARAVLGVGLAAGGVINSRMFFPPAMSMCSGEKKYLKGEVEGG